MVGAKQTHPKVDLLVANVEAGAPLELVRLDLLVRTVILRVVLNNKEFSGTLKALMRYFQLVIPHEVEGLETGPAFVLESFVEVILILQCFLFV